MADIAFHHQRSRKTNNITPGHEQNSGCFTVSNRTVINKVLYTNEDAPEMLLINVPPILRQSSQAGILYFVFELTYMVEIECFYDSLSHPQKVPMNDHTCTSESASGNYNYELNNIVQPNRHFHRQQAKGMIHNHSTHV